MQKFVNYIGSYPTYEEWKQKQEEPPTPMSISSYPTYEEWKPTTYFATVFSDTCSYPTYEEWKPTKYFRVKSKFFVLILPMRNGNFLRIHPMG